MLNELQCEICLKKEQQAIIYSYELRKIACISCVRKHIQPESSKREDLIEQLQLEMIERSKFNCEIIKAQLGCGTPTSMET